MGKGQTAVRLAKGTSIPKEFILTRAVVVVLQKLQEEDPSLFSRSTTSGDFVRILPDKVMKAVSIRGWESPVALEDAFMTCLWLHLREKGALEDSPVELATIEHHIPCLRTALTMENLARMGMLRPEPNPHPPCSIFSPEWEALTWVALQTTEKSTHV